MFRFPARPTAMIRIGSIWLATDMDMQVGTETALICSPTAAPIA
ncbi:hypothetical protein C4K19_4437 [Pseudomonas chlororaphis subsp. aurantiaca]|nr:hypothetical protein C4K19_4437 [Pseudomonas chlororaphis subsp. aurantiaca]AZD62218.1 hypothetical protein C4K18_4259 [Pseudomonas chlororaphis subsp. aurantiaca]